MITPTSHHNVDVVVLGAGIVGVSAALALQAQGKRVCLVDRQEPGHGTSFGNAGLIERASLVPYAFPRQPGELLRHASNRHSALRLQWGALPWYASWLWRYWRESSPTRLAQATEDMRPLIELCVAEHQPLISAANLHDIVRDGGWIELVRGQKAFAELSRQAQDDAHRWGLNIEVLPDNALRACLPGLRPEGGITGGIHWQDPWTVQSPVRLVEGYAGLFRSRGGQFIHADAMALQQTEQGWRLPLPDGTELHASDVVLALGADTGTLAERFGYRLPLRPKRGYHLHFRIDDAHPAPSFPVCDRDSGFVLAEMNDGVRLTTGVELALPDAPPNDSQARQATHIARQFWPLGEEVESEPWMGRRPCTPDMRPIIGPAPHHRGLWFDVGHAHHGLTLGPVSGRLLAELMTGQQPFTDPSPYSVQRFL